VNDRPAVWPALLTFAVALPVLIVGGQALLAVWAALTLPPGAAVSGDAIAWRIQEVVRQPVGLSVAVLLTSAPLAAAALIGAALSRERLADRLRTRVAGVRWGLLPAMVLGILALSNVLDGLLTLLGLADQGTLKLMTDAIGSARGGELAIVLVVLALGAGLAEELFFRGFLQTRLSQRFPPAVAIAVASVCFGIMHMDPVHSPVAALLGLYLGWITERARSIVPAIIAHVVNNAMAVLGARWPLPESDALRLWLLAISALVALAVVALVETAYRRAPPPAASAPIR
jgi:membrane protease YdiL (CAAX protease family)